MTGDCQVRICGPGEKFLGATDLDEPSGGSPATICRVYPACAE
jgi:hypothetical protein